MTSNNYGIIAANSGTVPVGLQVNSRIWCQSEIDCSSDRRLKDNIKTITEEQALHFLFSCDPKTFVWNDKSNQEGKATSGYIAQDFAKNGFGHLLGMHSNPALHTDNEDDFESPEGIEFSVNYDGTIPYLHAALLKAFKEINQLRLELDTMKGK
jgi:hypothetical protein